MEKWRTAQGQEIKAANPASNVPTFKENNFLHADYSGYAKAGNDTLAIVTSALDASKNREAAAKLAGNSLMVEQEKTKQIQLQVDLAREQLKAGMNPAASKGMSKNTKIALIVTGSLLLLGGIGAAIYFMRK